jgi:hypothetical protein
MRALAQFLLLFSVLFSAYGISQEKARFGVSDTEAIDQLFDRYNQAFSSKDYVKLRDYLQAPFVRFESVVTLQDIMDTYRDLREALDAQQYERSQLVQRRIMALSADRALVNGTYRRYRRDGSVLLEAAGVYLVSKSSGVWKICGF